MRWFALVLLLPSAAWIAHIARPPKETQDPAQVEIRAEHVAGSVYMLVGQGGNIGVSVGKDGILMVDDQFAPLAGKIRAAIDKLGEGKLQFVLNTHWHGDHTGGNRVFGREAPIIAHTNVRKRLAGDSSLGGRVSTDEPKETLPVITFDESLSIHFNDEEVRAVHFAKGHTDGDSVIFFTKSNVVHMGDHFFSGRFPFIDLDSGGDVEGFVKNISALIEKLPPDVKLIPGHGPLSTHEDLVTYHRMLTETVALVRNRIGEGKELSQIQAEGLPEEWSSWGWRFITAERWIEIVYRSLTGG